MSVQKNLCYTYWPPVGGPTACPHNRGAATAGLIIAGLITAGHTFGKDWVVCDTLGEN